MEDRTNLIDERGAIDQALHSEVKCWRLRNVIYWMLEVSGVLHYVTMPITAFLLYNNFLFMNLIIDQSQRLLLLEQTLLNVTSQVHNMCIRELGPMYCDGGT